MLAAAYDDGVIDVLTYDSWGYVSSRRIRERSGIPAIPEFAELSNLKLLWSADSTMLCGYAKFKVTIWDLRPGRAGATWELPGTGMRANGIQEPVAWCPIQSKLAVIYGVNQELILWEQGADGNPAMERISLKDLVPEQVFYSSLSWTPDGTSVALHSYFEGLRIIRLPDKSSTLLKHNRQRARQVVWSPDGSRFVMDQIKGSGKACYSPELYITMNIFDKTGPRHSSQLPMPYVPGSRADTELPVYRWSQDGKRIACTQVSGYLHRDVKEDLFSSVLFWDAETGQQLPGLLRTYSDKKVHLPFIKEPVMWLLPCDIAIHPGHDRLAEGENLYVVQKSLSINMIFSIVRVSALKPNQLSSAMPAGAIEISLE